MQPKERPDAGGGDRPIKQFAGRRTGARACWPRREEPLPLRVQCDARTAGESSSYDRPAALGLCKPAARVFFCSFHNMRCVVVTNPAGPGPAELDFQLTKVASRIGPCRGARRQAGRHAGRGTATSQRRPTASCMLPSRGTTTHYLHHSTQIFLRPILSYGLVHSS